MGFTTLFMHIPLSGRGPKVIRQPVTQTFVTYFMHKIGKMSNVDSRCDIFDVCCFLFSLRTGGPKSTSASNVAEKCSICGTLYLTVVHWKDLLSHEIVL